MTATGCNNQVQRIPRRAMSAAQSRSPLRPLNAARALSRAGHRIDTQAAHVKPAGSPSHCDAKEFRYVLPYITSRQSVAAFPSGWPTSFRGGGHDDPHGHVGPCRIIQPPRSENVGHPHHDSALLIHRLRDFPHSPGAGGHARPQVRDRIGGRQKAVGQVVVPRQRNVDLPFSGGR